MSEEIIDPRETPDHPRHRHELFGQHAAEEHLLAAYQSGRFHHAWLLAGPQGCGKATLAYRLARFILAHPDFNTPDVQNATSLAVSPDHPVSHRIEARGHSDLFVLTRQINPKTGKLRAIIQVEDARKAEKLFERTAGEGGWRICIVDAGDDLNTNSANAILKILEEPPERALFVVVSHAPGRLLPTIRSRCLRLDLARLGDDDMHRALAATEAGQNAASEDIEAVLQLADGSPGRALQLLDSPGARQFAAFQALAGQTGRYDFGAMNAIASEFSKRGSEHEFNIFADLLADWLAVHARKAALSSEFANARAFAACHDEFSRSIGETNALNLDRRLTLLKAFGQIEQLMKNAGQ